MVKILFLSVLLVNIVFFFWQYRKGAPAIYLPPSYENSADAMGYKHKILLPSEVEGSETSEPEQLAIVNYSSTGQRITAELILEGRGSELDQLAESGSEPVSGEQVEEGMRLPISACYQLRVGEYTQDMFAQENEKMAFKLELFEQQGEVESYLVLTLAALSYQEAVSKEQEMKQQGIDDLWLYRRGKYKWRISLGLFNSEEWANKAKDMLTEQTHEVLEVIPDYQTTTISYAKITDLEEQGMSAFEQKFSLLVEQKVECDNDKFSFTGSRMLRSITPGIPLDVSVEKMPALN